ncbi:MAG: hypothetical protein ACK4NB_06330, partial [Fimbriimonadales bacterium]
MFSPLPTTPFPLCGRGRARRSVGVPADDTHLRSVGVPADEHPHRSVGVPADELCLDRNVPATVGVPADEHHTLY